MDLASTFAVILLLSPLIIGGVLGSTFGKGHARRREIKRREHLIERGAMNAQLNNEALRRYKQRHGMRDDEDDYWGSVASR